MKKAKIKKPALADSLFGHILNVIGVVFIWRGSWYVLDEIDKILFGGSHILSSIGSILIGLILIYLPDRDLKELKSH